MHLLQRRDSLTDLELVLLLNVGSRSSGLPLSRQKVLASHTCRRIGENTYSFLESNKLFLRVDQVKNKRVGSRQDSLQRT